MFTQTLVLVSLVIFWYMIALFIIALIRGDTSIADIAWGPGFLLAALVTLWWQQPHGLLPVLTTVLVAVWAVRLAVHVAMRNWGRQEDRRYAKWRRQWGEWFVPRTFVQVFLLQGILLVVVALPALWVNSFGGSVGWVAALGALVWLKGFFWESVGDYQLIRFLHHPADKGKLLQSGLWRYSRHPNYFGEVTQWWGIWLMALSVPGGWLTIFGPLLITFLILKVSGVPMLEERRKDDAQFKEYARKTHALIPWFPKK
jgi:steroid 5-alpha reductase family enzyme